MNYITCPIACRWALALGPGGDERRSPEGLRPETPPGSAGTSLAGLLQCAWVYCTCDYSWLVVTGTFFIFVVFFFSGGAVGFLGGDGFGDIWSSGC